MVLLGAAWCCLVLLVVLLVLLVLTLCPGMRSAVPLGGISCGAVELRGDGR